LRDFRRFDIDKVSKLIVPVRRRSTGDRSRRTVFRGAGLAHLEGGGLEMANKNRSVESASSDISDAAPLSDSVGVHELSIEHPAVAAYLETIDASEQEIALVHAIDVGIAELVARRARARATHANK
jgi:hypothetical protein